MTRPLEGYRVADFSHVLAGPIATHYLCMQGADVIKVESGKGDTMRNYGGEAFADGMGPSFISVNTGKRSVVLDLKRASHQTVARKLVAWADVVVENFRPGVMQRLGLDFATCKAIKPGIVYCSISGFGQSGPLRENPAIDQIIQSMSGMMELSGAPGSTPMRVGFPVKVSTTGKPTRIGVLPGSPESSIIPDMLWMIWSMAGFSRNGPDWPKPEIEQ